MVYTCQWTKKLVTVGQYTYWDIKPCLKRSEKEPRGRIKESVLLCD